uniref:Uncharacterized protein n=1 Tax=Vespula pensylvanica TaxID=30213 RepID=A0A834NZE2_VESPE|nr:hypothetical protein H0235_009858 [Vespula pensylvanica]
MDSDNLTRASTTWLFRNPSESIEITLIKVTFQHLASLTISSRLCNASHARKDKPDNDDDDDELDDDQAHEPLCQEDFTSFERDKKELDV